jgi:cystathionine beta-synthase
LPGPVVNNVLELVGNTPLVRLNRVTKGIRANIFAKLEYTNPGGSVKDRIGLAMVRDAEKRGLLKRGYTIVEPTSGNTGMGLALVALLSGYKIIFTVPDKMSRDKIDLLRAFGATVRVTHTNVNIYHPTRYVEVAKRSKRDRTRTIMANQ